MRTADLVWTSMTLPKHRFMMWLAVQARLLTHERKIRLHIQVDDTERFLSDEKVIETTVHLYEECKWGKTVLQEPNQWT